ncbi:MAG: C25 family cysteine peptidase, partial [Kiritimatiellae bacterium]|nr:C25 family cysteine peptidase [Kiritimatiellia bacterium]
MRYFRFRIFVLICICTAVSSGFSKEQLVDVVNTANLIKLTYNFADPEVKTENGVSSILINGLESIGEPGNPLLPVYPSQIVLPQGASVKSFTVEGKSIDLDGSYLIDHAEFAQPLSAFDKNLVTPQNTKIYDLKSAYPSQLGYAINVGKKFGYSVLPFNLNPVRYIPADGKVSYYKELTVLIELSYDKNVNAGALSGQPSDAQLNDISAIADAISSIKTYTVATSVKKNNALTSASVDYVIIVPDSFDDVSINRLKQYHELYNGYSVTNITVEWINSNYSGTKPSGGSDLQTKIREFIYDAYYQWGTRFVMLAGDASLIPPRLLRAEVNYGAEVDDIPADMYFGCIEGTFDANANGIYGEPDDDVDLYAEVYVGRAAVASSVQFDCIVDKIVVYETDDYDPYLREVHMLGEYLGFGGVSDYAKGMMEQIRTGGTFDGYTTKGFEDSAFASQYDLDVNLYDEDATWPASSLMTLMNNGSHLFNHLGHASPQYSMKLYNSDLTALNNDKYFFIYSQGCMAGWFDNLNAECFAQLITRLDHGAFGVVMNARYGWGSGNSTDGPSERFARWFWNYGLGNYNKVITAGKMLEPGVANQLSKEVLAPQINNNCMRWITYELNLFGDAAAPFRFQEVNSSFTMTETIVNSTNSFDLGVTDPNLTASNLTVTVESYANFVSLSARGTLLAAASVDLPFDVVSETFKTNITLSDILTPPPVAGNTIVFTYDDVENPVAPQSIYYVMEIDNTAPVVSDISVDNVTVDSGRINFTTDEPVTGLILYGTSVPPASSELVLFNTTYNPSTGLIENHVTLSSLMMEKVYYFAVVVQDGAGNVTSVPVDVSSTDPDDYGKFVTAGLQYSRENFYFMSDGPLGWTHGGLNDSWAFGKVLGLDEYEWSYDGWQTGLNAPYTRPCNTWLASPFITATDIKYILVAYELDLASGAAVIVEGYDGGGWQELGTLPQSDLTGYVVNISALDTSKPFKIRFRLVSQTGVTSARGLTVLAVDLIREISNGVYIEDVNVLDTLDLSPNNNNDGVLDAGEIANIQVISVNLTQGLVPNVKGTIDLPSLDLSIIGNNTVLYGDMDVGDVKTGTGYVKVEASTSYNPAAETSYLLQTALSVGTMNSWVDTMYLYVEGNVADITGKVVDKNGTAIGGATVDIISESGITETATTLGDGTFASSRSYTIGDKVLITADATAFMETVFSGEVEQSNYVE